METAEGEYLASSIYSSFPKNISPECEKILKNVVENGLNSLEAFNR
jgi:hypothetical protein